MKENNTDCSIGMVRLRYLTSLVSLLLVSLFSCKNQSLDSISPQPSVLASALSVTDAKQWYIAQAGPAKPAKMAASSARGLSEETGAGPLPVDWGGATDTIINQRSFVLAPVQDFGQGFTASGYQSFRYLLLSRPGPQLVSAAVVEILVKSAAPLAKSSQRRLLAKLYEHYRYGSTSVPGDFTGFVFFYNCSYLPRTGQGYVSGRRLPGNMELVPEDSALAGTPAKKSAGTVARASSCTTYRIISHDPPYNVTVCQSYPDFGPLDPGNPGFNDPGYGGDVGSSGGVGGYGGGGGSYAASPITIKQGDLRPCAGQVVGDIQSNVQNDVLLNGPVANLIRAISVNPNVRITFNEKPGLRNPQSGGVVRAQTTYTQGQNDYTITLNSDFLQGPDAATDLSMASDIIHELLHVYMGAWANTQSLDPNAALDVIMQQWFDRNAQGGDHEAMSYMVSLMGEALYQYYYSTFMIRGRLNSINQNYCEYLVWGGLRSTEVYKKQAAKDPDWANRVIAYTEAERRPAKAGQTVVSITLEPRGNQPCK